MGKIICFLVAFKLLFITMVFPQYKYDCQWVLDKYNLLDFRKDTLQLSTTVHDFNYGSGDFCTSICDAAGNLLFYSGGCRILNKEGEIMENGEIINSQYAYNDYCAFGDFFNWNRELIDFFKYAYSKE